MSTSLVVYAQSGFEDSLEGILVGRSNGTESPLAVQGRGSEERVEGSGVEGDLLDGFSVSILGSKRLVKFLKFKFVSGLGDDGASSLRNADASTILLEFPGDSAGFVVAGINETKTAVMNR